MEPIKMQTVINYIEANLTEELSYSTLAALVAVSESDLQRSFKTITGMTISEYIRNRRLTNAALDLKQSDDSVLQIGLNYGYQTAESFNRAFKQFHGCTPTEVRNSQKTASYLNPLVIKLAKRGGNVTELADLSKSRYRSIIDYYNSSDEHSRLRKKKSNQLEFFVTMEYLNRMIPKQSRILDCCAGTGIYAFTLAQNHQVVASDLSDHNIMKIREQQNDTPVLYGIHQLDVCNMEIFGDESFDAVLCMGALYHLFEENDRRRAVSECRRVCRRGGILVFAYLNKWGSFFNGLTNNLKSMDLLYKEFETRNHEDVFYREVPGEIDNLCAEEGISRICNIGVDHVAFLASDRIDAMQDEEFRRLLCYQLKATEEAGLTAMSLHGLWIGRTL